MSCHCQPSHSHHTSRRQLTAAHCVARRQSNSAAPHSLSPPHTTAQHQAPHSSKSFQDKRPSQHGPFLPTQSGPSRYSIRFSSQHLSTALRIAAHPCTAVLVASSRQHTAAPITTRRHIRSFRNSSRRHGISILHKTLLAAHSLRVLPFLPPPTAARRLISRKRRITSRYASPLVVITSRSASPLVATTAQPRSEHYSPPTHRS